MADQKNNPNAQSGGPGASLGAGSTGSPDGFKLREDVDSRPEQTKEEDGIEQDEAIQRNDSQGSQGGTEQDK